MYHNACVVYCCDIKKHLETPQTVSISLSLSFKNADVGFHLCAVTLFVEVNPVFLKPELVSSSYFNTEILSCSKSARLIFAL